MDKPTHSKEFLTNFFYNSREVIRGKREGCVSIVPRTYSGNLVQIMDVRMSEYQSHKKIHIRDNKSSVYMNFGKMRTDFSNIAQY